MENKKDGEILEELLNFYAKQFFGKDFADATGTVEDIKYGTDCWIYQLRIDWTCDFNHKNHTNVTGEFHCSQYVYGRYGFRYGNCHNGFTKFPEPVLVIGFDVPHVYLHQWLPAFEEGIGKYLRGIVTEGMGLHWDACDAYEAEKEEKKNG